MRATAQSPGWGTLQPDVSGPLGVLATVRTALALYRADIGRLWTAVAAVVVPTQVIVFLLRLSSIPTGAVLAHGAIYVPANQSGLAGTAAVGDLISALMLLVSIGAAYRILLGRYLRHPANLSTSLAFAVDRAAGLLWVSILAAACVIAGFFFFILPGIYLIVALSVAVPVLMTEGRRGARALARSRDLVAGNWFHVLGCLVVTAVVGAGAELLFGLALTPLSNALTPTSVTGFLGLGSALSILASVLVTPVGAAVSTVLYVDMLVRQRDPYLPQLLASDLPAG